MVRRHRHGAVTLQALVYALIAIAAAATVISLVGPNVDLAIASLFYDPATGRFPAAMHPIAAMLRDHGQIAIATCVGCVALTLTKYLPWRLPQLPGRAAVFLVLSLALGPGLLVNGLLKEHWGRPRPASVTEFGGGKTYVDWWNPGGACDHNCSFISGEAATAAWMLGPAMLAPPPWRAAAIGAAVLFTATMAGLRVAAGAHFFTDAVFAVLSTVLILLAMHALIYRWWPRWTAGGLARRRADQGVGTST
jgi:membrane-associated PAP2 superfamily phosphatase